MGKFYSVYATGFQGNRQDIGVISFFMNFFSKSPKPDQIHGKLQIEFRLIRSQVQKKETARTSAIQQIQGHHSRSEIASVNPFVTLATVDLFVNGGQMYMQHVNTLMLDCESLCNKKIALSPDMQASLDYCWAVAVRNKQKDMEGVLGLIAKVHPKTANIDVPRAVLIYLGLTQPTADEVAQYAWKSMGSLGVTKEYLDAVFRDNPTYSQAWQRVVFEHAPPPIPDVPVYAPPQGGVPVYPPQNAPMPAYPAQDTPMQGYPSVFTPTDVPQGQPPVFTPSDVPPTHPPVFTPTDVPPTHPPVFTPSDVPPPGFTPTGQPPVFTPGGDPSAGGGYPDISSDLFASVAPKPTNDQ